MACRYRASDSCGRKVARRGTQLQRSEWSAGVEAVGGSFSRSHCRRGGSPPRLELERCAFQHLSGRGHDWIRGRTSLSQRTGSGACVQHAVE